MIYLTDTDTDTLIRYMLHTGYCVDTIFEHGKQHVNMVTGQVCVCVCFKVPASFVDQGLCLQDRETTEYVQCFPQKMDGKATWLLTY